jgi:hypothetical protein
MILGTSIEVILGMSIGILVSDWDKFSSAHCKPISYARAKNSRGGRIKAVETEQTIIR